jgi:hypothetical protein
MENGENYTIRSFIICVHHGRITSKRMMDGICSTNERIKFLQTIVGAGIVQSV